jgi:beta-glucosidase
MKNNFLKYSLISIILLGIPPCSYGQQRVSPVYLNANAPVKERVRDLLQRMTLEEKIGQMCQYVAPEYIKANERKYRSAQLGHPNDAYAFYPGLKPGDIENMVAAGVIGSFLHVLTAQEANHLQMLAQKSRLKIPLLLGIDAIHGNGMVSGSTIYPIPLGLAATWDTSLVKQLSVYTAAEMRATGTQWAFSPNLDVGRDARWGRIGETFGEDPFLVSTMGVQMVNGLQGGNKDHIDVLACAKHLIAGSEPINGINAAPTDISERTLNEIYLPPYLAAVKAGVSTVMPAHNEINGTPGHANKQLMDDLLRKQWGFEGFYISDWMDIERLVTIHGIAKDTTTAVLKTMLAGMDMHMHGPGFSEAILRLIKEGKLTEQRINESAGRILESKFRLGLFENAWVDPQKVASTVYTRQHTALSLRAAEEAIVLLKNDHILPFSANKFKRILVTGPNANNQAILGDWSQLQPEDHVVTVVKGMQQQKPEGYTVEYFDVGTSVRNISPESITLAAAKAKEVDAVVVVVGENSLRYLDKEKTSGENMDRDDLHLVGRQQDLVEAICKTGKPVILVLVNSRPLDISSLSEKVSAIVEAWEPGSMGGTAVANILYGKTNPSGKLPVSFPRSVGQIHTFYNYKPSAYTRGYVTNETGALFSFGQGLSYTKFTYGELRTNKKEINDRDSVTASIDVTNSGHLDGEEIVQLYIHEPASDVTRAVKQLKGFFKVSLQPGQTRTVSFRVTPAMLSGFNAEMRYVVDPGEYTLMVGGSSLENDLKTVPLTVK